MPATIGVGDFLAPGGVVARMESATKKALLQDMASRAASALGVESHAVFDALWERERLGSTGVGRGIAIPHARLEGLEKVAGFFARLAQPVAFDSLDEKPVDLVFLLLAPAGSGADHLQALAAVSRRLHDAGLCESLRRAEDSGALQALLTAPA